MSDNEHTQPGKAALYERYEDALFRIALMELMQEELEALERAPCDYEPSEAAQSRVLRLIDRTVSRRRAARFMRHTLPRLATGAACAVLVIFVGLTTALATSPAVRRQVLGLMIRIDRDHTELSLAPVESGAPADVPDGWMGAYYPAYIPNGYRNADVWDIEGLSVVYTHRRGGHSISFMENGENASVGISSEDAQVRYLTVHGMIAILSVEPDNSFISWSEGDRFFIVQADNDDEQMLIRIADSVRPVDRKGGA